MSNRFMVHLALSEAGAATTAEALARRVASLYPEAGVQVRPLEAGAGRESGGAAFLFHLDNTILTVIPVAARLPRDAYEAALDVVGVWPGAAGAMAAHREHVIVSHLQTPGSHTEALETAGVVTLACAALSTLLPVAAAVWTNAAAIAGPEQLRSAAEAAASGTVPVLPWIAVRFLEGPPAAGGARRIAALTSGLQPFVGRELEWMPSAQPPEVIAHRLLNTCHYLMTSGMVLADGNTLGISATERIRARFAEQGQRPGIPVVQLTPEEMEPAGGGVGGAWAGKH